MIPKDSPDPSQVSLRKRRGKRAGAWSFLLAWVAVITAPLLFFKASHLIALPASDVSMLVSEAPSNSWSIVHVLSEECACSRSVIEYLEERNVGKDVLESVILLEGTSTTEADLAGKGFSVRHIEGEEMCQKFGAEGVPFFQVVNPSGEVVYSGAYFVGNARGNSGFLDLSTAADLKRGIKPESRLVYGCPTSNRLKQQLDPFSLK